MSRFSALLAFSLLAVQSAYAAPICTGSSTFLRGSVSARESTVAGICTRYTTITSVYECDKTCVQWAESFTVQSACTGNVIGGGGGGTLGGTPPLDPLDDSGLLVYGPDDLGDVGDSFPDDDLDTDRDLVGEDALAD